MDRLVQRNVLAMSGRAVEASGDVDVLLLDKTGTITLGNRQATEFVPVDGVNAERAGRGRPALPLADETPEGRSIVVLAKEQYGLRGRELGAHEATFIPFSATTRMSGSTSTAGSCARARPTPSSASSRNRAAACPPARRGGRQDRPRRRDTARRRPGQLRARRDPPEGHRQGWHERALRRAARDGHPHGDDHRRQPGHRRGDRRRKPGSTTSSPRRRPRRRWR